MADPAVMSATSPDGIAYLVSGSPINPVSESAQQATSVQVALSNRSLYSYTWANAAARTGETGMREGDTGYQQDSDQPYWYLGSTFGWVPILIGHSAYGGGRVISSSVLITPAGSTGNYVGHADITLPVGFFNSAPSVQVTPWSASPNTVNATYSNPTAAGFTIYLGRTDNTSPTTVNWTASQ
jgi:2',3'-cyclic-nucleotide 2'-phosphodiesterase (5'-nucleotidase family)